MKNLRTAAALLAAITITGCAVQRPSPEAQADVPPQWFAPLPHNGTRVDLRAWWQQLNDPLLVEIVEAAQTASPTVATARSRIEQARATRVAAGAALLPTLDAQASAQRGNTTPPTPLATIVQAGLATAWEIDLFGGNGLTRDAAQARLLGAQAGWHDARVSVAAEAANTYISLRTCERLLDVTVNDAKSRAETSRVTELSAQAGFTAPASAALARASTAEASARATQQRALCDIDVKALVALTGMAEPQLRSKLAAPWFDATQSAAFAIAAVPANLLAQRPDVYQAQLEVAAASADAGAARAERYPQLALNGSVAVGRARVSGVSATLDTWSIGPLSVSLPIFDGGRRAANTVAAEARYDEAALLYHARVRQAVREVEEALVNLESTRLRSGDAATAVDGYQLSFTATEARYRSGLASLVELEDSRRTLLAAQTAQVNLQRERSSAWVALYRAMGGGWASTPAGSNN